jgi:hypothetical protein
MPGTDSGAGSRSGNFRLNDIANRQALQAQRRHEINLARIAAGERRDRTLDGPLPGFAPFTPGFGGAPISSFDPRRQADLFDEVGPRQVVPSVTPLPFNPPPQPVFVSSADLATFLGERRKRRGS